MNFKQFLAEGKRVELTMGEIEHNGDVDNAVDQLQKAGCKNIKVIYSDFDSESMTAQFDLPDDCKNVDDLLKKAPDIIT